MALGAETGSQKMPLSQFGRWHIILPTIAKAELHLPDEPEVKCPECNGFDLTPGSGAYEYKKCAVPGSKRVEEVLVSAKRNYTCNSCGHDFLKRLNAGPPD